MPQKSINLNNKKKRFKMGVADYIIYACLILFAFVTFYQIWYVIIGSFSNGQSYSSGGVYFIPRGFTLKNYSIIFEDKKFWIAYRNTILRTLVGVSSALIYTSLIAYAMSSRHLKCRKLYYSIFIFTLFFSGGIIPNYILYKVLGLYDTFWLYIIPAIFSVYNMIIISNFYKGIPYELYEVAAMDGASEMQIWWRVYIPLSKPVLATVALWLSVNHWNSYMGTMLYTKAGNNTNTLQFYLKHLINEASSVQSADYVDFVSAKTVSYAGIIVALIPIMAVYPFLQKHYTKGIMVGSVKE